MKKLYYGDNLDVMRAHVETSSVDLIYLDPPFNSNASYNVLFRTKDGERSRSQTSAFEDTWHWNEASALAFDEVLQCGRSQVANMVRSLRQFLGEGDMMAYLAMMAVRLLEMRRTLKPTGSLYLHCDPTASHYLKLLLDAVFGPENFLSEVIWRRTGTHSSAKRWGPVHDVILVYAAKAGAHVWNRPYVPHTAKHLAGHYRKVDAEGRRYEHGELTGAGLRNGRSGVPWRGFDVASIGRHWTTTVERLDELHAQGRIYLPAGGGWPRLVRYESESKGRAIGDVWDDIAPLNMTARERLGYPTQKPVLLLERIIEATTQPGALVLDPFCGCGTTVHAAQKLGRRWIGVDVAPVAVNIIARRIKDAFPGAAFEVKGIPRDLDGARQLAADDKHLFQLWAVDLIDAHPYRDGRKGADGGVDGFVYFKPDGRSTRAAVVSVKGGANVGVDMVRSLIATIDRLGEPMGIFLTLTPPTAPMLREAAAAGVYDTGSQKLPRVQIVTIADALEGKGPRLPFGEATSYRQAPRETAATALALDLGAPTGAIATRPAKPKRTSGAKVDPVAARKQGHLPLPIEGGAGQASPKEGVVGIVVEDGRAPRRSAARRA